MRLHFKPVSRYLALLAIPALAGCADGFLDVTNPEVIEAGTVNPVEDAQTFSLSAQQNFASAYGWDIMYSAWFIGEAYVTETFPTRNEFARRDIATTNSDLSTAWTQMARALATNERVIGLLGANSATSSSIHLARAYLYSGYSMLMLAEMFCEGTIPLQDGSVGPRFTSAQMLDSAVTRFTRAIEMDGAGTIGNAARVGRARAHLQAGRKAQAASDAAQVPAGFNHNLAYVDDLAQRNRLSNRMWQFTQDRGSIGVAPAFRVNDPRIRFLAPGTHTFTALETLDQSEFYVQQKYPTFASPIRLASKMEADYIAAEATGTAAMLALIQARRAANDQPAYSGPTDDSSVLTELMEQRGREFYLEGKRLGDFRRNPNNVLHVPQPGAYRKGGYGGVGNQTCLPVPVGETDNNPNFS